MGHGPKSIMAAEKFWLYTFEKNVVWPTIRLITKIYGNIVWKWSVQKLWGLKGCKMRKNCRLSNISKSNISWCRPWKPVIYTFTLWKKNRNVDTQLVPAPNYIVQFKLTSTIFTLYCLHWKTYHINLYMLYLYWDNLNI